MKQTLQLYNPATHRPPDMWPFPTQLPPAQPATPIPFNPANYEDALL